MQRWVYPHLVAYPWNTGIVTMYGSLSIAVLVRKSVPVLHTFTGACLKSILIACGTGTES